MKPPQRNLKRVIHRARVAELPPDPATTQFALDWEWFDATVGGDIELVGDLAANDGGRP